MTCRHCQSQLSPYIDGVLSPQERQEVITHLAQCLACTKQLQQLEENRQLIRALPIVEVSEAMTSQLRSTFQNSKFGVQQRQSVTRNTQYATRQSWWNDWRFVSFGTLTTAAASVLFYFAMMQAPPKVSAAEVVMTMDQLLSTLDTDEGEKTISEETRDEDDAVWQEDFNQGFVHEEDEPN